MTGTKTASIGKSSPSERWPVSFTEPGTRGGSPRSRNSRQAWPSGGSWPLIRTSKKLLPSMSSAGRPNSSSAGSDHLETDPWPSVRTKNPPTICRSSASSGSAASAITASAVLDGGFVRGFIEGLREITAWGGFSSLIGRSSHSSNKVAAARESSEALPPAWAASLVVNRSS